MAALVLWIGACGPGSADNAQYFYDPAGRLIGVIDPVNGSAQYNYDAVGNILSVVRRAPADLFVAQVSPSSGAIGAVVTIFGTGFDTTSDTTVSFNGVSATPSAVTSNQITVAVPGGATTGPVTVTSPAGTMTTASNFTIPTLGAPTISGFSPAQVTPGDTITITGTNFDTLAANDKVLINGRYAQLSSATSTRLTAVVPSVGSGNVSVVTSQGSASSSNYLVVAPNGYAFAYSASNIASVVSSSIGSAPTVSVGSNTQIGLILFDATAGQRLALQVSSSSFPNAVLQVYGPDGGPLILPPFTGFVSGTVFNSMLLRTSGTYTVAVIPGGAGSATISLINAPDVTASIATDGTPISLTTSTPGQAMSLTFSSTQRVSLQVQTTSGSLASAQFTVSILGQNEASIIYNSTTGTSLFTGAVPLLGPGNYEIRLKAAGGTGSATFTLFNVPPDPSIVAPTDGTRVSLTTTAPGQVMDVSFAAAAGGRVSLVAQGTGGTLVSGPCYNVTVYETDNYTKVFGAGSCGTTAMFSDVVPIPVSGTYMAVLTPSGTTTGSASFQVYNLPPDPTTTVTTNGTQVSLSTTTPGQDMEVTFTGTAGQRINVQLQATAGGLAQDCYGVRVIEPDGSTRLYGSGGCGTNTVYTGLLVLPVAGTYTVVLDPNNTDTGSATFAIFNVPPDVTASINADGSTNSLTTTAPAQNMSATFTATAGQRVSLLAQATSGTLTNTCYGVSVIQPDGSTKVYGGGGCGTGALFTGALVLPVAGTYTIALNINAPYFGTMQLTLYNLPADASATITPGGGTVSLTTTTPGQDMNLSFSGAANQRVSLLVQGATGSSFNYVSIMIIQPDGSTRLYSGGGSPDNFSGALTLPVAGTYTINLGITGTAVGTIYFTLYDVPPDVTGTTTVGQAAANYTTTVPGQAIRVQFTGQTGQTFTVNIGEISSTPANACYNITILKPDGSTLLGSGSCSSTYSSGSLSPPANGTYTVVVTPTSTSIGTFSVGVSTP